MSTESAATKRQYAVANINQDAGSSASEGATRGAPKQKTTARPTATRKSTTIPGTSVFKMPTIGQLYQHSIKKLESDIRILDGRIRSMGFDSRKVTTDSYAKMCIKHLDPIKELEKMDGGLIPAFNLMLYVADASHTDCDITAHMSGYGDSDAPFGLLDIQLMELIEKRHAQSPATRQDQLHSLPEQWKRQDVGVFKYKSLSERYDVQKQNQKLELERERRVKRHERRVAVDDWVAVALEDLEEERGYLEAWGVDRYFPKSIDRLSELMRRRGSAATVVTDGDAAQISASQEEICNGG